MKRTRNSMVGKQLLASAISAAAIVCWAGLDQGAIAANSAGSDGAGSPLPGKEIQRILQVQGTIDNGTLDLEISRDDISQVKGPFEVEFTPDFELNGDAFFQPLDDGQAFLNGDIPLKGRGG